MKFVDHFVKDPENTNIKVSKDMTPLIVHPLNDESFMDNENIYYLILEWPETIRIIKDVCI